MARLRGNRWQADAVIDGARVRKSFKTEEAALEFERQAGMGILFTSPEMFKEFVDKHYIDIWGENRDDKFVNNMLRVLYRYVGEDFPLVGFTTEKCDELVSLWRREGFAPVTINHRLGVISKMMRFAQRRRVVVEVPKVQRQRVSNLLELVWTKDDEHKAMLFFDHIGKPETKWVCQFLLYTGARKGEAYRLRRDCVTNGWIMFDRRTTKSGKTRHIPCVPKAQEAWDALCKLTNSDHPLEALSERQLRADWELLRQHFKQVGNREFVPHMLRHTCATRLVQAGVALPQVMKWMGHGTISVTMRYVYVAPKDLDLAAAALAA